MLLREDGQLFGQDNGTDLMPSGPMHILQIGKLIGAIHTHIDDQTYFEEWDVVDRLKVAIEALIMGLPNMFWGSSCYDVRKPSNCCCIN